MKCWGANESGQLGLGDKDARGDGPNELGKNLPAISLNSSTSPVDLGAGLAHSCAVSDDGSVRCWGSGSEKQLGYANTNNLGDDPNEMGDKLAAVSLGSGATKAANLVTGGNTTCVTVNGTSWCWGQNAVFGGNPTAFPYVKPLPKLAINNACWSPIPGQLNCFGVNDYLQCGFNLLTICYPPTLVPVQQVPGKSIAIGAKHICAINPPPCQGSCRMV